MHFQHCLGTFQQNGQSKIKERKKNAWKIFIVVTTIKCLVIWAIISTDILCCICRYDFYLISQHVRQGTVTPTHYIVVHDKSELKPDYMQRYATVLPCAKSYRLQCNPRKTWNKMNLGVFIWQVGLQVDSPLLQLAWYSKSACSMSGVLTIACSCRMCSLYLRNNWSAFFWLLCVLSLISWVFCCRVVCCTY